jgi:hypothetical protein
VLRYPGKFTFIVAILLGASSRCLAGADDRLERLAVDVRDLAPACRATDPRKDPANAELVKEYPAVTSDPRHIQEASILLFGDPFDYGSIEEATFLTYLEGGNEGNEMGIFAWRFKTEADAEKGRQALMQSDWLDEERRKGVTRKARLLVFLWLDDDWPACREALEAHVRAALQ